MTLELNKIHEGDAYEFIKEIDDESIDFISTDPDYGYNFMNKNWGGLPPINFWEDCNRVLKSGSFMMVCSAPRLDVQWRMASRIEEAGFEIGFTPIYYCYASGFPKAMNISKAVDKRLGIEPEIIGEVAADPNKFPEGGDRREEIRQNYSITKITKPSSPEAKALDGSYAGFQPKPAVEVVMVAMKPLSEKSYVDQALKSGKGVTWLDDARIPFESEDEMPNEIEGGQKRYQKLVKSQGYRPYKDGLPAEKQEDIYRPSLKGRFPANLLVSDDILNDGRIIKGSGGNKIIGSEAFYDGSGIGGSRCEPINDSGSFCRYFSLDAWWSERIKTLPKEIQKTFPFLIVPKPSKSEKNKGLKDFNKEKVNDGRSTAIDNAFQRGETERHNIHPTVKSVALFSYLITLGSRRGDVILDPFMGSGTAGIAAYSIGRSFIGFEKDPSYFKIGNHRIVDELKNKKLEAF